jgi:hypothetical protein
MREIYILETLRSKIIKYCETGALSILFPRFLCADIERKGFGVGEKECCRWRERVLALVSVGVACSSSSLAWKAAGFVGVRLRATG